VKAKVGRLGVAFTNYQEFFVEYLASEGVLDLSPPAYLYGKPVG